MILDAVTDPTGAAEAAEACLRSGGVVVLPTETVYGVAALAVDPEAVGELFVDRKSVV